MSRRPKSRLKPYLWLFLLLLSPQLFAQHIIKGKVTDTQNQPLIGATIQNTKTKTSTQTDAQGQFSLSVNQSTGTIHISFLGYQPQQASYSTDQTLNIQLIEDASTLQAVEINTGYYSVKAKLLTGSIASVKAEEIAKSPVSNPLSALQGRVAGAQIVQNGGTPGSNVSVIIRGQNGIETSTHPLYLVDGVPFNSASLSSNLSVNSAVFGSQGSSPLNTIPPENIESIEVLKDADATAIYGSRGANGVVLITTKKGKLGSSRFNTNLQSGFSDLTRRLAMLSTPAYLQMRNAAITADNTTIKATDYDLNGTWDPNARTDWQETLLGGTAKFNNLQSSLSGGNVQSSFLLSANYQDQGNTLRSGLGYRRLGAQLSAAHQSPQGQLSAQFSASYTSDRTQWLNQDLYFRALGLQPNAPNLYNPDGSLNWAGSSWVNPLRELENGYYAQNGNLQSSASLTYRPLKDLEAKIALGYNQQQLHDRSTTPTSYYDPAEGRTPATSVADHNESQLSSWLIEPQLSYRISRKFGSLSALFGLSFQGQQRNANLLRGVGFASDALIESLKAATTLTSRENGESQYRYGAAYARLNYSYQDRYIVNLTGRRDGSSRFGPGRQFANFGAIGAAYLFSEEQFIKTNLPILSFGKLRASYGTSGNDQIGDYEYLDTYQPVLGYNGQPALAPLRLFNADFGWESNRKFEAALEFGLFKDRLRGSIGHYRNRSSSQLVNYPLALSTGFASVRANLNATIENTGWEFELSGTILPVQKGKLGWNASFNLTIPQNRLVDFPNLAASSYASRYQIGRPLSISKLYELLGVNSQTGLYEFRDYNNDGVITSLDRQYVVDRVQRYYGGLNNSFSYGPLEFSFLLQFVSQDASNLRNQFNNMPGRSFNQPLSDQGKYWTQPGDLAELQRLSSGALPAANTAYNNFVASNASVSDASYLRLKNVSLSYRSSTLLKGVELRLYAQGQNLWTLTNYLGIDPESASLNLPPLRTIVFGLQFNLQP